MAEFVAVLSASATRASAPVPAEAPDSLPEWLFADSMWVDNMPNVPWLVVKNLVVVAFVPTATQSERQAAIDLVDGEVVGGDATVGGAAGLYYVRLPEDPTGRKMRQALEALRRLPQVKQAMFEQTEQGLKQRP